LKALTTRSALEGIAHHVKNPVRIYEDDGLQCVRIENTRSMVCRAQGTGFIGNIDRKMVEVGCGCADISGWVASNTFGWHAYGIDCHGHSLLEAQLRYGHKFTPIASEIFPIGPGPLVDLVILSEVLEHLNDPNEIAESWLKRARASVISHPLGEADNSQLSGGDHCFSFDENDHKHFFDLGGHEILESTTFPVGAYTIILSRGKRRGD
jgi:hypothetical protein